MLKLKYDKSQLNDLFKIYDRLVFWICLLVFLVDKQLNDYRH